MREDRNGLWLPLRKGFRPQNCDAVAQTLLAIGREQGAAHIIVILQEFCLQSDWSATDADRAGDRKSTRLRRRRFGAAYLTVINHGAAADRLIAAATQMAAKVQFHQEIDDKGVMRMRELPAVDIGPGASVTFKPGGTHIMIVGLKQQLKEGQPLPLTLEFEKAGKIDLQVPVTKAGAMGEHDLKGM